MIPRSQKKEILDNDNVSAKEQYAAYEAVAWQNRITFHNILLRRYIKKLVNDGKLLYC